MTKATLLQFSMLPMMFIPMTAAVYMGVMEAYMNGVPMMFLKFSRKDEQEADFLGLQYMYKAGYDPNAFVGFFGKVMDEERRSPGSMAKVFADHPPTGDRIIASEEEIQKILPKRDEYLVSTSEFDDIKARLQTVITQHKRQQKGDSGPTLRKRESPDPTSHHASRSADHQYGRRRSAARAEAPRLKGRQLNLKTKGVRIVGRLFYLARAAEGRTGRVSLGIG